MADFDPDAYLKKYAPKQESSFDPNAYLAKYSPATTQGPASTSPAAQEPDPVPESVERPADISAPLSEQAEAVPSTVKGALAETGLQTAAGIEYAAGGVAALRAKQRGMEAENTGELPLTEQWKNISLPEPHRKFADAAFARIDAAAKAAAAPYDAAGKDFSEQAKDIEGEQTKGKITQAVRGLTKGAGMMAQGMIPGVGLPLMATAGAAQAYGEARNAGKPEEEAESDATRTLIGLAAFGGSNKLVASGITRLLGGSAGALKTFLVQTLGQTAGNEATSRVISAYEAAMKAPPGKRLEEAAKAAKAFNLESTMQNVGFAALGGADASGKVRSAAKEKTAAFESELQDVPDDHFSNVIKQFKHVPDTDPRKMALEREIIRRDALTAQPATAPTAPAAEPPRSETPQVPSVETVSPQNDGGKPNLFQQLKAKEAAEALAKAADAAKYVAPASAESNAELAEELKAKAVEQENVLRGAISPVPAEAPPVEPSRSQETPANAEIDEINRQLYENQTPNGIAGTPAALGDAVNQLAEIAGSGDSLSEGTPADAEGEKAALIQWATDNNLLGAPIDKIPSTSGSEHEVYFMDQGNRVVKVTRPGTYGAAPKLGELHSDASPVEYLRRLQNANEILGDDIRLHGVTPNGEIITSQPAITGDTMNHAEIASAMAENGFVPSKYDSEGDYFSPSDGTLILDLHPENALKKDGVMYPFDVTVIKPTGKFLEEVKSQFPEGPTEKGDAGELTPAIRTPEDILTGEDHPSIIETHGLDPAVRESDDAGFFDEKGNFVSRADAADRLKAEGIETAKPDEAHTSDLPDETTLGDIEKAQKSDWDTILEEVGEEEEVSPAEPDASEPRKDTAKSTLDALKEELKTAPNRAKADIRKRIAKLEGGAKVEKSEEPEDTKEPETKNPTLDELLAKEAARPEVKKETSPKELWEMNRKEAAEVGKRGNAYMTAVRDAAKAGKPVPPEVLDQFKIFNWAREAAGLRPFKKEVRDTSAVRALLEALKSEQDPKMKRRGKESGASALIPDIADKVVNAGRVAYEKGMQFAEWSIKMAKAFGEAVRPYLSAAWKAIVGKSESGAIGGGGGGGQKMGSERAAFIAEVGKPAIRAAAQAGKEAESLGHSREDAVNIAIFILRNAKEENGKTLDEAAARRFFSPAEQTEGGDSVEKGNEEKEGQKQGVLTRPGEGDAVPSPPPIPTDPIGIQNAVTDALRDRHGIGERDTVMRRTFGTVLDDAKKILIGNSNAGRELVDELAKRPRPLTDTEDALLTLELARRKAEYEATGDKKDLEKYLDMIPVAETVGTAQGRGLNARKMMINSDYTLAGLARRVYRERGRPLTPEEAQQVADMAKNVKEDEDSVAAKMEVERQLDEAKEVIRTHEATIADLKKVKEPTKEMTPAQKKSKAEAIVKYITEKANNARERLRARAEAAGFHSAGAISAEDLADYAIIGAEKIVKGAVVFTKWSSEMVKDFGDAIKPHLRVIYDAAKEQEKAARKEAGKPKEKTPVHAKAAVKADATAGEPLSHKAVYDLARAYINAGIHGEDAVMKAVHADIKESYPEATERDVRRAFSEYGKVKFPSKDAVDTELRELRRLTSLQESIDRENAGLDALHSGLQRDKATQPVRKKQKQLNELLKKREGPPSPEKLASREEAKQTALRNAIADLDKQLRTGEKPPARMPTPDSPATEQLRAERDAMREKLKEIEAAENPPKPEDERKLEALEKRAKELRERIAAGDIAPRTGKPTVDTKEVAAAKEEIAKFNEQMAEMRKAANPPKTPAEKQVEQLGKVRQRLDDILSGKLDPAKPADRALLSSEAENIRGEIDAMRELHAQMQRDAKPAKDPGSKAEQAKIKALEKAIDAYSKKTAARDFTPAGGTKLGPDSARVAALKEIRDSRRAMYEAVRDLGKTVKTPDEIYNERRMKDIAKRQAELDARHAELLATGKISPKTKLSPKFKFPETAKAEAALQETKAKIDRDIGRIKYENRSPAQKAVDFLVSAFKVPTAVAVTGHGTVGMFTHAGALAYRPTRAATFWRNFGRQFGMWANKDFHNQLIFNLRHDPQFEDWKNAGLSIDPDKTYTDYSMYAKWLENPPKAIGAVGRGVAAFIKSGERGFDALKLARLEMSKADWDRVSPEIKADPEQASEMRKQIAAMNNKATGAIPKTSPVDKPGDPIIDRAEAAAYRASKHMLPNAVFFAPRLYASRWMRVVFDPAKTVYTFANWRNEGPAARRAATIRAQNAAEFAATLVGALVVNQAILAATGSKQQVNITDPTQSDWLKFKGAGKTITADGGLLDPIRLIGQIVWGDLIHDMTPSEEYRDKDKYQKVGIDLWKYLRGKLTPTMGFIADTTGKDFTGRPMPWNTKPQKSAREAEMHPRYTWAEWVTEHGPIPISGGTKVIYDKLRERGMSDEMAKNIIAGAAATAFEMTGAHISEDHRRLRATR